MVSQFGSLGYTIMGKTADLTVVQKTIIDTLHEEGKTQCRKQFCCFILFRTCDNFSGYLDKQKVKKNSVYMHYYSKVWGQYYFYFFKESNTFIQQRFVKWIKGDSKDLYCEKSFLFGINAVLFNFVLIKEKSITCSKNNEAAQ